MILRSHMWKTFWGEDFDHISRSNRRNVVPGAWRIEVSPLEPAEEDCFLHVIEIADQGTAGLKRVELVDGANVAGAVFETRSTGALFDRSARAHTGRSDDT